MGRVCRGLHPPGDAGSGGLPAAVGGSGLCGDEDRFRTRLDEILSSLEARIQGTPDQAAEGQVGDRNGENFYRLLGAYRGVSEALVAYAGSAGQIDWSGWRESRF